MKQLRSIRVGQVVSVGFGLILLLALLIAVLGRGAYDISRWQRNITETRSDVERLTLELEIIANKRTEALRRYLETNNVAQLAIYQQHQTAYVDTYSRLANILPTAAEMQALQAVELAENKLDDKAQEVLSLYNSNFPDNARFIWNTEGVTARDALFQAIERLRQVQGRTSATIIKEASQTETWTVVAISIFIPLLLIGGVAASILITVNITHPISNLVKTVTTIGSDLTTRVKPSGPKEISFLGDTINEMATSLAESSRSLQEYKNRLESELALASQIQASFLPADLPQTPNLDLAVFWKSAREVGGDFYAFIELEDRKWGIAVGDVSGKGAPAAMVGALSVGLLQAYAANHSTPETLLSELNKDLCTRLSSTNMNVACCYAILDEAASKLTVANAGCMYPYLRRGNGFQEISARGLPLGAWSVFDYEAISLTLQPDDLLIFSTDGLIEAQNERLGLFGFERFQAELMKLPEGICTQEAIERLVQLAMDFSGPGDLYDDITVLAARMLGEQPVA